MAADRFLTLNTSTGLMESKAGAVASTANAIVALDGTGKIASAQLPAGYTDDVLTGVAISETIADGDLVELYEVGTTLTVRKAGAKTAALQEAKAFVVTGAAYPSPGVVDVHFSGPDIVNVATTAGAIAAGAPLYLDPATPASGKVVDAPPAGPDYTQFVGFARAHLAAGGGTVAAGIRLDRPVGIV